MILRFHPRQIDRRIGAKTDFARCGLVIDLEDGFRNVIGIAFFAQIGIAITGTAAAVFAVAGAICRGGGSALIEFFDNDVVSHDPDPLKTDANARAVFVPFLLCGFQATLFLYSHDEADDAFNW